MSSHEGVRVTFSLRQGRSLKKEAVGQADLALARHQRAGERSGFNHDCAASPHFGTNDVQVVGRYKSLKFLLVHRAIPWLSSFVESWDGEVDEWNPTLPMGFNASIKGFHAWPSFQFHRGTDVAFSKHRW